MSRSDQGRVAAHRGRLLALTFAALLAGACGDDDSKGSEDSGSKDGGKPDSSVKNDASVDAGGLDAGRDAGRDAGAVDSAVPETRTKVTDATGTDAPTLSKVAFFADAQLLLIAGSDKNGDIKSYTIEFFDGTGNTAMPVAVSFTGDSTAEGAVSYTPGPDFVLPHDPNYQEFVLSYMSSLEFFMKVKKITVTVEDSGGRKSAPMSANLTDKVPTKTMNQPCDINGFDKCATGTVCAWAKSSFTCQAAENSRKAACANADLVLAPPTTATVTGTLGVTSLWDAPTGCAGGTGNNTGNVDRVVKLTLAAPASSVVLSTGDFDSVLYKLDGMCEMNLPACTTTCPMCSEGDLTLTGLAAGDYYIVVDSGSTGAVGSSFTLTATVTP